MTDFNPLLENLQERVVQDKPLKLIYAQNTYAVFNKGTTEFHGAEEEFIGDQPLEGVKWKKTLKSSDAENLPEVFSCKLKIIWDHFYYTIYNKKVMKRALQSPVEMAALVDQLTDSMTTKPKLDLNKVLTKVICTKDNYNQNAWEEITEEEATIDNLDKAIAILRKIKAAANGMVEPSDKYNKGYQKPNDTTWNKVVTNSESRKSLVLTIDPDFLDDLEIYFLADVARDSNLNPYKLFKEVIVKKLTNNALAALHDEKSVVYRIINEDGITHEQVFGSGNSKFGYHMTVIGGMIPFTNSWALVKGA